MYDIYINDENEVKIWPEEGYHLEEVSMKEYLKLSLKGPNDLQYFDGEHISIVHQEKVYTAEERLQERTRLHQATDNDYAKYSRQVRMNIDKEHSQQILDYIDYYNVQVSDTVYQPGFPQEVTYPEYILP